MALPPTALDNLLSAARSAEELAELLAHVGCLTPHGMYDRFGMVSLVEHVAEEWQPPRRLAPGALPPGSTHDCRASLWEALSNTLTEAGYLDMRGWPAAHDRDMEPRPVQAIIDAVRASTDARSGTVSAGFWLYDLEQAKRAALAGVLDERSLTCAACARQLPEGASFCGWCGERQRFSCACGAW
jgi:hypothetical protein